MLRYSFDQFRERASFIDQIKEVIGNLPSMDRKKIAVTINAPKLGDKSNPNWNTNYFWLEARLTPESTIGLANAAFTGVELQKIAGALDAAGVITNTVKTVVISPPSLGRKP